ncbi:MAG: hypothetical protein LBS09_01310 [Bacteroidales bacterium]|jgi:hypothetical protein|nr:hypothetical protein [Bacteroidales bacterium]
MPVDDGNYFIAKRQRFGKVCIFGGSVKVTANFILAVQKIFSKEMYRSILVYLPVPSRSKPDYSTVHMFCVNRRSSIACCTTVCPFQHQFIWEAPFFANKFTLSY